MNVELKLIDPRYKSSEWAIPDYKTSGAAAIDVLACVDTEIVINPGEVKMIPLGIAFHLNDAEVAAILMPRSGLGSKEGVILGNTLGLIDSDFQGQVQAPIWNRNFADKQIRIQPGDRIAQLMFVPVVRPTFKVVEEFSETTERGEGGFGSTGVATKSVDEVIDAIVDFHTDALVKKGPYALKDAMAMPRGELAATFKYFLIEGWVGKIQVEFKELIAKYPGVEVRMALKELPGEHVQAIYTRHYKDAVESAKKPISPEHPQAEQIGKLGSYTNQAVDPATMSKEELIDAIVVKHTVDLYDTKKDAVLKSDLGGYEELKRILDNTIRQRSMIYAIAHFKEIVRGYTGNAVEMFLNTMDERTIYNIYIRHYGKKPLSATFGS